MRAIAQILVSFVPLLLAGALPFMRVARAGRIKGAFFMCWGLLVFWVAFFSLGIPLIVAGFSRELAHVSAAA
jgi:hypothetical protein